MSPVASDTSAAVSAATAGNEDCKQPPSHKCPVEEVALVVPETDDPTLPVMTIRAWFLGLTSCTVLIFLNTFFAYRTQPLSISTVLMQIAVLPIGKFMAATLPAKSFTVLGRWSFNLNPGPFNVKEHVIITIMANGGVTSNGVDDHPMGIITVLKTYYKLSLNFLCAFLIVITTQMLGFGWAGMLRKYLVDPIDMWWPSNVAQVSLFRALHEKEPNSKGKMTRTKFFLVFMTASFTYYLFPGYLFPMLTFFSWACWVWPRSITAQQIGSAYHGLGLGAFTLDWAGISAYRGSPLVTPFTTILNVAFGFAIFIYIIIPLVYWKFNTFNARKFPLFSNQLFTSNGHKYDIEKILTPNFELNSTAYQKYGKLYLSPLFALSIGSGFARITATLSHVALFHGSDIWKLSRSSVKNIKLDTHAKLMKCYKQVPMWWYVVLLVGSIPLPVLMSFFWKEQVQLPWWGFLFAFGLASLVALPIGVIQATTNQHPGYDVTAQFIIGYLLPGKPIANMFFKSYGHTCVVHSLCFLADLKLGHYMKIPPRCTFTAQLAGTAVSGIVNLLLGWWMLANIENICDVKALHPESPWTCPKFRVMFDTSVIWGLIGPEKLFGPKGMYRKLIWLFVVGAVLPVPVWTLSKIFPEKKWIPLINIPVISHGFAGMPPAAPTNIASGIITGIIFNYLVFKYRRGWWQRYNYVLSAALDAGTAFMGVLLFFALQNEGIIFRWWGSQPDHCPLASCPTAPDIVVEECPVFN